LRISVAWYDVGERVCCGGWRQYR